MTGYMDVDARSDALAVYFSNLGRNLDLDQLSTVAVWFGYKSMHVDSQSPVETPKARDDGKSF